MSYGPCLVVTLYNAKDCSPPGPSVHGLSRQENWSGLPFPPPGDLPDPGIEPGSPAMQADSLPTGSPGKPSPEARLIFSCSVSQFQQAVRSVMACGM